MEKKCFKCHETKPLADFYRHRMMADGHLNKCKSCTKADASNHRETNLERVMAYDRQRGTTEKRREANQKSRLKRISTEEGRLHETKRTKAWQEKNRLKRAAHILVGNAIKYGRISKDGVKCERCGTDKGLHAHHEDYFKPLEINWLCKLCHGERHREINEERRRNK
jgi:hypothetical protein